MRGTSRAGVPIRSLRTFGHEVTMNPPLQILDLAKEVWIECDPVKAAQSRYHKPERGLPPQILYIHEASFVDWDKAICLPPYSRTWKYIAGEVTELPQSVDSSVRERNGMYWTIGHIEYCIDPRNGRAVYGYWLGPRYGRGYKTTFTTNDTLRFTTDRSRLVWIS